jgi:hypothetical protein
VKYKIAYFALWVALPFLCYWALRGPDLSLCLMCGIILGLLTTTNWRLL